MRNSITIAGKELAGYFVQPVAYVVMTVFLLLGGFFFFSLLQRFAMLVQMYAAMQNPQVLQRINLNQIVSNRCCIIFDRVGNPGARDHDAQLRRRKRAGTYELLLTAPCAPAKSSRASSSRLPLHADHDRAGGNLSADPGGIRQPEMAVMLSDTSGSHCFPSRSIDRAVYQFADPESDHRSDHVLRRFAYAVCDLVAGAGRQRVILSTCCAISRCRIISRKMVTVSSILKTSCTFSA